jgi:hypothetical protein
VVIGWPKCKQNYQVLGFCSHGNWQMAVFYAHLIFKAPCLGSLLVRASTYEISTSAITQARYILIRQGYRSSAHSPISVYPKAKKEKGKITVANGGIEISHDTQAWVFHGDTMTAAYKNAWTDTWARVQ